MDSTMASKKENNILLHLEDVWKIYRMGEFDVPALSGIDLAIKAREFVAITGPSGCGKSTMLNMIGCLDMPTRGKVLLEEKDISQFKSDELARVRGKKIGFILSYPDSNREYSTAHEDP
jgi:putative ABC transport system ATP-binding protein